MKNPLFFSIIIPVYNAQNYLERCLNSCIYQSYPYLEIIAIDDCSTDDSPRILQTFQNKVKIFKNENNFGALYSRIKGIRHAGGDYILFLDSDDYLSLDTCKILNKALQSSDFDIIHFRSKYHSSFFSLSGAIHYLRFILPTAHKKNQILSSNDQIMNRFYLQAYHFPKMSLTDKAYHKKLFEHLPCNDFCNIIFAEDILLFFFATLQSNNYYAISSRLYNYCLNPNSTMQNKNNVKKRLKSLKKIFYILVKQQGNLGMTGTQKQALIRLMSIIKSQIILEQRRDKNYLISCIRSLKYWNRLLTYIRIFIFLCTLGRIKL